MKRLFLLFALLAGVIRAATGDVSVTVRPDGWSVDLYIEGFTSGATYDFDLAANNVPGADTPYLTVVSEGYDNTGALGTVTRTVYLTSVVRVPYSTATQAGGTWSGVFQDGETITCSTSGATAIIVGNQSSGPVIRYRNLTGVPLNTQTWTGGTSGATFVNSTNTVTTLTVPTNDEFVSSAGMTVRVALSDYVYVDDNTGAGKSGTAPTITVPAAWATNTGGGSQTSNALSAAAVTQSSTAVYPPAVANWSRVPLQRATGNFDLGVVAFHGTSVVNNGTQVMPGQMNIAAVKFTVSDTSAHTVTTTVTAPVIDSTQGDPVPVIEWVGTIDVSTLTALNVLTCNFIAYPLVGDAASVIDSSAGTAQPTPLVGPITWLNDKSNTYGITVAYVTTTGSDAGANTVYDIASYPGDASAYQFATINKAAAQIKAFNNARGTNPHNDVGGGIIYLADGAYSWTGAATSTGTTNDTWVIVTRSATSTNRAAVTISAASAGNGFIASKCKVTDVTLSTTGALTFNAQPYLWIDQCDIAATGTALITGTSLKYLTRNTSTTDVNGFYRPYSNTDGSPAIIRGNTISGYTQIFMCYTALGNLSTAASFLVRDSIASMVIPVSARTIFAYNNFKANTNTAFVVWRSVVATTYGGAFVQNMLENKTKGVNALVDLAGTASASEATTAENVIVWNNTFVGQRQNFAYNEYGTDFHSRYYWSVKNNIFYDYNIKTDISALVTAANGSRTGNWPDLYGAGWSGNVLADSGNGFGNEFAGLKTVASAWTSPDPESYFDYTAYAAYDGTGADGATGAGNGTYTLTITSPAVAMQREKLLPYDIAGTPRTTNESAGAYHYGTDSTGNFFFLFP